MKTYVNTEGYLVINGYRAHRVVAETFLHNPRGLAEVDHINENKLDNRACNLEWVTPEENLRRYAFNHYRGGNRG